jgi:hypothetical protein
MPIPPWIIEFVRGKIAAQAIPVVRDVWSKVRPPAPLYIVALKKAVRDADPGHRLQGREVAELDVEAALRNFDMQCLDQSQLAELTSQPDKRVEMALFQYMTGGQPADADTQAFVQKVATLADQYFQQAITNPDNAQARPLWQQAMVLFARDQQESLDEIRQGLASLEQAMQEVITARQTGTRSAAAGSSSGSPSAPSAPQPAPSSAPVYSAETDRLLMERITLEHDYNRFFHQWNSASQQLALVELELEPLEERDQTGLPSRLSYLEKQQMQERQKQRDLLRDRIQKAATELDRMNAELKQPEAG